MLLRFIKGAGYPIRGGRLVYLQRPGLVRYWAAPVAITLTALALAVAAAVRFGPEVLELLWRTPEGSGWWGEVLAVLYALVRSLVVLGLAVLGVVFCIGMSTIVAAPFNDALSVAVERIAMGDAAVAAPAPLLTDTIRSIKVESVKFLAYLCVLVPMFVASLAFPGAGQLAYSAVAGLLSVVYFALDYTDWPASRRGWGSRRRLAALYDHTAELLGFGSAVAVLLFLPLINLLFMPAAVAGGTLLFLEVIENKSEN